MALQISAFKGYHLDSENGGELQILDGPPVAVSAASFTGSYTVPVGCSVIRIKGTGSITWDGVSPAETFDGIEFRGLNPGTTFTVA